MFINTLYWYIRYQYTAAGQPWPHSPTCIYLSIYSINVKQHSPWASEPFYILFYQYIYKYYFYLNLQHHPPWASEHLSISTHARAHMHNKLIQHAKPNYTLSFWASLRMPERRAQCSPGVVPTKQSVGPFGPQPKLLIVSPCILYIYITNLYLYITHTDT